MITQPLRRVVLLAAVASAALASPALANRPAAKLPSVQGAPHVKVTPKARRTAPHSAPRIRARSSDATIVLGSYSPVYTEDRGCTNWAWYNPPGLYMYTCTTAQYIYGEWYQTDMMHYYWTGSRWAYYGDWRCWKIGSENGVVVIGDSAPKSRCAWV